MFHLFQTYMGLSLGEIRIVWLIVMILTGITFYFAWHSTKYSQLLGFIVGMLFYLDLSMLIYIV